MVGLFTRWFHRWALLAGWAVAMVYGTAEAYRVINPATKKHFGGSTSEIPFLDGRNGYIALTAFVLNLVITVGLTLLLRALGVSGGHDATLPEDDPADADDSRVRRQPAAVPG